MECMLVVNEISSQHIRLKRYITNFHLKERLSLFQDDKMDQVLFTSSSH